MRPRSVTYKQTNRETNKQTSNIIDKEPIALDMYDGARHCIKYNKQQTTIKVTSQANSVLLSVSSGFTLIIAHYFTPTQSAMPASTPWRLPQL